MDLSADFDKVVMDSVLKAVAMRFDLELDDVEVTSIEVDREELKILIQLSIRTNEKPDVVAQSYFGLTGKVREALGTNWSGFFPVITPNFSSGIHA